MNPDFEYIYSNAVKLTMSLLLGAALGAEREYKGRNIGFRTIILITLGSTLFTILSLDIGGDKDPGRIASNIVTGVGFLGAGAIFRDGVSVRGITTASLIWISAAIGMACGIAQYEFATLVTFVVLVILIGFAWVQQFIDNYNRELLYKITISTKPELKIEIEENIRKCSLKFTRQRLVKVEGELTIDYEIKGSAKNHQKLAEYLSLHPEVAHFEV